MPADVKTPNIGLNQWGGNEYVKRQDFVDDNKKIDEEIGLFKEALNNIYSSAEKTSLKDVNNNYESDNVEGALIEIANDIFDNKRNILDLQVEVNGQRIRGINIANSIIDKLEGR